MQNLRFQGSFSLHGASGPSHPESIPQGPIAIERSLAFADASVGVICNEQHTCAGEMFDVPRHRCFPRMGRILTAPSKTSCTRPFTAMELLQMGNHMCFTSTRV